MKTIRGVVLSVFGWLFLAGTLQAASYTIDQAHSSVGFRIRHIVSMTKGQFNDFSGTFSYDPAKPEKSSVQAVIKTASIDTNNEKRDAHLRTADFFDVEKYPEMTFKSTAVTKTSDNVLQLTGDLTLHGVTKPVTLVVEITGAPTKDPWGGLRAGFSARGTINRKDFGIVWNKTLDAGAVMLGDDVHLEIEVEGVQDTAGKKTKK